MKSEIDYLKMLAGNGGPSPEQYDELDIVFLKIWHERHQEKVTDSQMKRACHSIGPAFSTNTMQGFAINRPHGYAQDFELIDRIYMYWLSPDPDLICWDYYFHSRPAAKAVRKRKEYFKEQIARISNDQAGACNVLNLGSGPCRDILEFFYLHGDKAVSFDCADIDENAIHYAKRICTVYLPKTHFHNQNVFRLQSNEKYSLIWSAGLFDYLDDRSFTLLLRRLGKMVACPGEIIIGNFAMNNPTRYYMKFDDWVLNYRTAEQLADIASRSGFTAEQITIVHEGEKINLFLHVRVA